MELKKVNEVSPRAYAKKNDITRKEVKESTPEKWIVASALGLVTLMYTSPDWSIHKIGVVFGCRTIETDSGTELFNFMDLFYNIFLIGTISIAIAFFLISIKNLIMWRKYSESKRERNRKKMRYLLVFFAVFFLISVFLKISINMELKNS